MASAARISSRQHSIVQLCRRVAAGRGDAGMILLDGEHLVDEAVRARIVITALLTRSPDSPVVVRAALAGASVYVATPSVLEAASPVRTPGEMVALATWAPAPVSPALVGGAGVALGLVDVQDPGNVGSVIRSANALGASAVVAAGSTADPAGWRALRGAMGSTFHLPVARGDVDALFVAARTAHARVIASTLHDGEPLDRARLTGPALILLGNEGAGLPPAVVQRADARLHVPMRPGVNSLNVAVTAALILYEAARQQPRPPHRPA
ncbi:MAG: TrmH family RNA methyltransferase [Vicinamibacterales bacterium]